MAVLRLGKCLQCSYLANVYQNAEQEKALILKLSAKNKKYLSLSPVEFYGYIVTNAGIIRISIRLTRVSKGFSHQRTAF